MYVVEPNPSNPSEPSDPPPSPTVDPSDPSDPVADAAIPTGHHHRETPVSDHRHRHSYYIIVHAPYYRTHTILLHTLNKLSYETYTIYF